MANPATERRLARFVRSWPEPMAKCFERYRLSPRLTGGDVPLWIRLPRWLADRYGGVAPDFLDDVLWAQYALFMAVRIQDDVYDGQAEPEDLLYAADDFLIEAQQVLEARFPGDESMRQVVAGCLRTTIRAIVEVDVRQRSPGGFGVESLEGYARVAEVLKVGSIAVCRRFDRGCDLPHVGRLADALAVAGQILDDLADIEQDVRRGRLNFAAAALLGEAAAREMSADRRLMRIGMRLVLDDALAPLVEEIGRRLDEAASAAEALSLDGAVAYVEEARRQAGRVERAVNGTDERVRPRRRRPGSPGSPSPEARSWPRSP